MKDLVELIHSLQIKRMKSSGLWHHVLEPGSLMEQLCDAIYDGRVSSDQEAIALLYPGKSGGPKYLNCRKRLNERILSVLFLLEFKAPANSDRQNAYLECNRKWAAAMMLTSKNALLASKSVLEDLLKQSIYYEFTELTLSALSALRHYHGIISGDAGKYNICRELYLKYQQIWLAENEAEDAYTHLSSQLAASKTSKTSISQQAQQYFNALKPSMAQSNSFRLHFYARLVQVLIYSNRNDYSATAKVCHEALEFFKHKEFESALPTQAFYSINYLPYPTP